MDDKPVKRAAGGAAIVAMIVVLLLILPMVYLLAIGPIVWLHRRGHLRIDENSIIVQAYAPAQWAANQCSPFNMAMETYISLWEPPAQSIGVAPHAAPAPASAATPVPAPAPAVSANAPAQF